MCVARGVRNACALHSHGSYGVPSACACTQAFEAVQLKQDYAKGHSRMATALMAMNLYREAQQSYHTALRLEPGNEAVMTQLRAVD